MKKCCYLFFCLSTSLFAESYWMTTMGLGMDDTLIQSREIGSAKVFGFGGHTNLDESWSHSLLGYGALFLASEAYYLKGGKNEVYDSLTIVAIKPALRFYQDEKLASKLYYEMSLGLSYFSNKNFESIRLSTDLQFAMHFGIGWHFDENKTHSVEIRYNHYSNGYIDQPNQGLDFMTLNYLQRL